MREIRIKNRKIGDLAPAFIIAEAGINHDGKLSQAKNLVEEAANLGADAVKFQMFRTEEFCGKKSEYFSLFKNLEFTENEWYKIAEFAASLGIIFTASVFGEMSADLLNKLGSPVYKIASGDLTNLPLLHYVALKKKPMILSTGMSTLGEIEDALMEIHKTKNTKIALLHCVSMYPAKYEDGNLTVIQTLKNAFKVPVGFSDHTIGTIIPVAAVAMGADIIEKHFTLDKSLPGPDHKLSLDPKQFKTMVQNIRSVESAFGDGLKKPTVDEAEIRKAARRSLVAKVDIMKGTVITEDLIKIVRPGDGIEPKFTKLVCGRIASKDIPQDSLLKWNDL